MQIFHCRFWFNPKLLTATGEIPYEPEDLAQFEDHDLQLIKDMFKRLLIHCCLLLVLKMIFLYMHVVVNFRYDVVTIQSSDEEVVKCLQEETSVGWNPKIKSVRYNVQVACSSLNLKVSYKHKTYLGSWNR